MAERNSAGKVIAISAGGVVALGIAAAVGAAVVASLMARRVITPPRKRDYDIRILGYTRTTITLSSTPDTRTPGRYGLWFSRDTGHLRVGEIIAEVGETVTRELLAVDSGDLTSAANGRFSGWFYLSPRELGFDVEDVVVDAPVGPSPAWLVPAAKGTDDWVIQVHGRGVTRAETIRAVPVFRAAGYTSLLVSYRNDSVAPDSADRRYALGGMEWLDVEAAIDLAVARGARTSC